MKGRICRSLTLVPTSVPGALPNVALLAGVQLLQVFGHSERILRLICRS